MITTKFELRNHTYLFGLLELWRSRLLELQTFAIDIRVGRSSLEVAYGLVKALGGSELNVWLFRGPFLALIRR